MTDDVLMKKKVYAVIFIMVLLTSLILLSVSYLSNINKSSIECKEEFGCLNDKLIKEFHATCSNAQCTREKSVTLNELAQLANIDYEQVIYARRFQYDFSKRCGALELSWRQQHLFADECSYLLFSKGKALTGYIRGNCFSSSYVLEHLENNFWFSAKDDSTLLNQRIHEQTIYISPFNDKGLSMSFSDNNSPNSVIKDKDLECFSSFDYQSP